MLYINICIRIQYKLLCGPARCKKLPRRPRNGMVIAPRTAHGMLARFRCKDGYILKGAVTTKCHFGKWTGRIPWCKVGQSPSEGALVKVT